MDRLRSWRRLVEDQAVDVAEVLQLHWDSLRSVWTRVVVVVAVVGQGILILILILIIV